MKQIYAVMTIVLFVAMGTSAVFAGTAADIENIKKMLNKQFSGKQITSIKETPVKGLYQAIMPPKILYVSADAKYLVSGDLIEISTGKNITMRLRDSVRADALELAGTDSMIIFAPKGETKHTVTVFTDIDCGYCRKLHDEMADYNKLGIKIRYMAYPRAGFGSESFRLAQDVWCAKDRNEAMNRAKSGKSVPHKTCDDPVREHYILGEDLGVRGTPALVLENGQIVPGYVPADRLFAGLEQFKKEQKK